MLVLGLMSERPELLWKTSHVSTAPGLTTKAGVVIATSRINGPPGGLDIVHLF